MASGSQVPSGQLAGHGAGRVEEEVDAHALAPGRGLAVERALGDVDQRVDECGAGAACRGGCGPWRRSSAASTMRP